MSANIDWRRLGRSHYREDRELSELAHHLERHTPGITLLVASSALAGQHPRATARMIEYGTVRVPLTSTHMSHVQIGDRELREGDLLRFLSREHRDRRFDRTLQKAAPLTEQQVIRISAAHAARLANASRETFARFVSMSAIHDRNEDSWRDAIRQGLIMASEVRRFWIPVKDGSDCARCARIEGLNSKGVGLDEQFVTGEGERIHSPPLCPRCRCTVWIKQVHNA